MIPWRDSTFLKDEDDLALLDHLHSANEEPVTGKQFYEHPIPATEFGTDTMVYFNNLEHDGSTKNHILLFGLDIGLFLTITGLLILCVLLFCISLALFGILNILIQTR